MTNYIFYYTRRTSIKYYIIIVISLQITPEIKILKITICSKIIG